MYSVLLTNDSCIPCGFIDLTNLTDSSFKKKKSMYTEIGCDLYLAKQKLNLFRK